MFRFPHQDVYLARTKLSYVSLPGVLADGKRDRAGRVDGFVAVERGNRCELILLRDGEPFQAGVVGEHERGARPLEQVVEETMRRGEQGEEGHVGYFGAEREQLRLMLSTLLAEPPEVDQALASLPGPKLFPALRERKVSGVVEVVARPGTYHYLCFEEGSFRSAYLADDRDDGRSLGARVRDAFETDPPPRIRVYPLVPELRAQVAPAMARAYEAFLRDLLDGLALEIGVDEAETAVEDGRRRAGSRYPLLHALQGAWSEGEWVASHSAEDLTAAMSSWVIETLALAGERADIDPSEFISSAAGDRRYVLREQGFFRSLPWPIAI